MEYAKMLKMLDERGFEKLVTGKMGKELTVQKEIEFPTCTQENQEVCFINATGETPATELNIHELNEISGVMRLVATVYREEE